jgi:hypothetical protein
VRESFAPFCTFMLNDLEGGGKVHTVAGDPGGTTCWGFAQKFNMDIDVTKLNEESATARALANYWIPNGCDALPFPQDIIVFDAAFNQSATFARTLGSDTWHSAIVKRLLRYREKTNPKFRAGVYDRAVQVCEYICRRGM